MTALPQSQPRSHSKTILLLIPLFFVLAIFGVLMIFVLRPQVQSLPSRAAVPPNPLAPNSATEVSLMPGSGERVYAFAASASETTLISLESRTTGFAFAAQVRDAEDDVVAQFDSRLQVAALALAPQEGEYKLALSSLDPDTIGTVKVSIGAAAAAQANAPAAILSRAAPPCQLTTNSDAAALVRSAPHSDFEVIGSLPTGAFATVLGLTDDGWYAVNYGERQGWLQANVAALVGQCGYMPRLLNPVIPQAAADQSVYLLEVDRDATGQLREALSQPYGDPSDLIWVRAINLYNQAPNNYRDYVLTLNCTGIGAEHLRWGSPYDPTLRCGESATLPFLYANNQHPITVVFAPDTPQSYVEYMLTVTSSTSNFAPTFMSTFDAVG